QLIFTLPYFQAFIWKFNRTCLNFRGKPNLLDMGSLMIKPIQRVMKYPLLLCELFNATPMAHPDHRALQEALAAVKSMNTNINELKRRKDLVLKYKKNDDDESLKEKFARLNIHSISKKSKRVTGHLKILTGGEPQVKDETFNKEEKLFRSLEKTVKLCVKNISLSLQHLKDSTLLTAQSAAELQDLLLEREDEESGSSNTLINTKSPSEGFANQADKMVLAPLSALQALFPGPQKLIQKRYDKLLDCHSYHQKASGEEMDLARKEYEALNAQLVEELQTFNRAAKKIVTNCLCCFITLLRDMMLSSLQSYSIEEALAPLSSPSITEVQQQVLEEVQDLNFFKEKENNSITFIERKLSFEKKKSSPLQPEFPRQTESHRSAIISTYNSDLLYQAKRKCNATQELDIDLYEGEIVAVVEQKDPFGSTSRWLVDTGALKGYVYSSFLKPYKPAKAQKDTENVFSVVFSSQTFYAVHAFQARSHQELSLQEYQRVRILRFSDLSGNKEWWLAEAKGQKGYVPANYLGKMTYA
uniref:Rho guanine nucleotide exchange factor 38 n=1 Tax=Salvator merianae TaxID=96440 RepID=A0A8D0C890_SALMN